MNPSEITQLAAEIVKHMPPSLPIDIVLWDGELIGKYLNRSKRHVLERVVIQPTFPKAIRMPKAQPLWKAKEVIAWVEKYKEAA